MLFIPISLLNRWLSCSVLQIELPLQLPLCSSAPFEAGFWHPDGTQMESVGGRWEEVFSEVSEQMKGKKRVRSFMWETMPVASDRRRNSNRKKGEMQSEYEPLEGTKREPILHTCWQVTALTQNSLVLSHFIWRSLCNCGTVGWEWREIAVWRLAEKAIGSVHLADIKNSTHSLYLVCIHYHWAHFPAIHKMKWFNRNWVICRDVDWPRECHTEWRKSEREKQIPYINARMWNLEQWYRWTHF